MYFKTQNVSLILEKRVFYDNYMENNFFSYTIHNDTAASNQDEQEKRKYTHN